MVVNPLDLIANAQYGNKTSFNYEEYNAYNQYSKPKIAEKAISLSLDSGGINLEEAGLLHLMHQNKDVDYRDIDEYNNIPGEEDIKKGIKFMGIYSDDIKEKIPTIFYRVEEYYNTINGEIVKAEKSKAMGIPFEN